MASKTYRTPAQFARQFARDISRMTEAYVASYHAENHKAVSRMMRSVPVELVRSNVRDRVEGKRRSPDGIRKMRVKPFGIVSVITVDHKAFHALDWGRRRQTYDARSGRGRRKGSVSVRGGERAEFTRLGGTTKAPRGFTRPIAEKILGKGFQIKLRVKAIKNAERSLR